MTLLPCPSCSKRISTKASTCPNCGDPLAGRWTEEAKDKSYEKAKKTAAGALVAVVLLGWLVMTVATRETKNEDPCGDQVAAWTYAQIFVRKDLKAPSTAKFAGWSKTRTRQITCGKWAVTSYVDSQNSFGAMIRTNFAVIVRYTGESRWELEKINTW